MTIAVSAFQPTGCLKIVLVLSVLKENFSKPTLSGTIVTNNKSIKYFNKNYYQEFFEHPHKEYEEAKLMIKPAKMIRRYKRKPYGLRWSSQNLHEIEKTTNKFIGNSFCQNLLARFDY